MVAGVRESGKRSHREDESSIILRSLDANATRCSFNLSATENREYYQAPPAPISSSSIAASTSRLHSHAVDIARVFAYTADSIVLSSRIFFTRVLSARRAGAISRRNSFTQPQFAITRVRAKPSGNSSEENLRELSSVKLVSVK